MGSRFRSYCPPDCKVYVGDLGSSASKHDLEDAFSHYGPLRNVWVARNPPGFAFVEFEDPRDAEDSVKGLDGRSIAGRRVRVEVTSKRSGGGGYRGGGYRFRGPSSRFGGGGPGGGRRFNMADERCFQCGERGHFARDCHGGGGGGSSRRRSYSRSHSRDRDRKRSPSRSRSRSRSRSSRSSSRGRD